ncbi:MAG TPA: hypothetical protein VFY45_00710 [Baekduia sp.]|nr:hypothetical protein [Baekduia sp.]
MESSGQRPSDPEVPLGDAAIATEIANAAARGRGADRAPTLDQLLAAFGEPAPTPEARRRVAAALRVAGMGVRPDLLTAEPGQRLLLLPPGVSSAKSRGRALVGLLAVAVILAAAAAGATLLNTGGTDDRVADKLPSETSTFPVQGAASSATPASTTTPAETTATDTTATGTTETEPTGTDTTATETTTTETTPAETTATTPDEEPEAAEVERKRAARIKRERAAAKKRQAAAAAAGKGVTVRVDASVRPTFLCVDNGHGTTMFSGTLTGKKIFRAKRVRMNIGLASTRITVNGNPVRLDGSPAGLDITRKGGARSLALGQRPCG